MWHVSRPKTHSSDVAPSSRRLGGHNGPTRRRWSGSDTPGSWERCLAPQAILNDELLLNHGRSHGQVTLPPCQRGWVGPRDRSASVMLRRSSSGQNSRFVRDLRARCLVVFGRWCVEEAGLFFCQKGKPQAPSHPGCSPSQHQSFASTARRVGKCRRVESNRA